MKQKTGIALVLPMLLLVFSSHIITAGELPQQNYDESRWNRIHFKPYISAATNEQCLSCHQEVLNREPREASPAGVKANQTLAWYQTLNTYSGEQQTFHQRHLKSIYAVKVMDLKCTTCHQGNDPRDETSGTSSTTQDNLTMRKMVDPYVCAMCHGQFNAEKMGVPESWYKSSQLFGDNCLTCHAAIRTERHKGVTYLKADAIEAAAKEDSDVCFGCHGGRAWYNIPFPYLTKTPDGTTVTNPEWPGWSDNPRNTVSQPNTNK